MSFKDRFSRPGPGIEKDAPRKKGLARLLEIVLRDAGTLILCGLLTSAGFLPLIAGILAAISASNSLLLLVFGLAGGAVAGPFLCALYDAILRMLRDEPAFWWHTYKKALAQDWRASLLPGAVTGLLWATVSFLIFTSASSVSTAMVIAIISILISLMILPLWFAQIALMDLPTVTLLKNALILAFGYAPRTIPAALMQALYWGIILYALPWSLMYVPLFGLWVISLITMHTLYLPLNKTFAIEDRINAKREKEMQGCPSDDINA